MEDKDGEKRFANGDVYEGEFSGALPHGKGKYRWRDGTAYEGDWEEGKMTGKGRMTWRSGGSYEGDFSGGYLHGFGVFADVKDGSVYRGSWRMNVIHGVGEKRYANSGDSYEGTWKEGLHEGSGKYSWGNGGIYIGSWKGGKMNGRGVMKWANGDLFDGVWANGLRHGNGIYRFCDGGGYYFGMWSRGLKDGNGIFYPAESHGKKKNILLPCSSLDSEGSQRSRQTASASAQTSGVMHKGVRRSSSSRILSRKESLGVVVERPAVEVEEIAEEGVVYEREYVQGVLINEKARRFSEVSKKCKARNKFHSDKASKKASSSCIDVIEGRWSHYLSLSLQLGIRYTVGKITPVPVREVRSSDFGDRARIKMYFPRRGSQFTPPHDSIDFYWKDYCPMVFRNLREMFKLDAADYMMSICGDDGLRELSSPGKSGSIFYLSHDDRFVIKTLNRSELKVLLKMLPNYYSHVGEHENTLITKFFGLHHIKLKGGRKVRFVVMGNMFYTELQIHRRYDLKGSTHGRFTDPDKIDENSTMKDCDLQYEFHMDKLLRRSLFKQISLDCKFLESQCIIDYSLLVGVHFRAPEQLRSLEPPDAMQNLESLFPFEKGENSHSMRDQIPPNALILVTHEPGSVSSVPGPHIRGKTLKAYSLGDREVDVLLPGTARLRVQLGVNMPAQARHKLPHDEADSKDVELFEVYDVIVYMGIIDILQEFDLRKRLECACKSMKFDPQSISVAEPGLYARRFTKFLEKIFPNHP